MAKGNIFSNIDNTPAADSEVAKREQSERRREYIQRKYAEAEEDVQQGLSSATRRYWFQREGCYSYDPLVDNDINVVLEHTTLPIKERVVHPDGTMEKVLAPAAQEALRIGFFCSECEERQPESTVQHQEMMDRAEKMGISIESWEAKERKRCAYCFSPLGIGGDEVLGQGEMTGEQKNILGLE